MKRIKIFFESLIGLLIYAIIGFFCFLIAGLDMNQCIGYGIIFGFVVCIINDN